MPDPLPLEERRRALHSALRLTYLVLACCAMLGVAGIVLMLDSTAKVFLTAGSIGAFLGFGVVVIGTGRLQKLYESRKQLAAESRAEQAADSPPGA